MTQMKYDFSEKNGQAVYKLMREAKGLEQYKRMQAVYYRIWRNLSFRWRGLLSHFTSHEWGLYDPIPNGAFRAIF